LTGSCPQFGGTDEKYFEERRFSLDQQVFRRVAALHNAFYGDEANRTCDESSLASDTYPLVSDSG
jgi:hypothetical protein